MNHFDGKLKYIKQLDALRCIGACGIAPAVQINGTVYPKMSVDQVPGLIEQYKAGGNA